MTALMTVEEARWCELHEGQLVETEPPKFNHQVTQHRLYRLLDLIRSADVAVISAERHRHVVPLNDIFGAPDLVAEVQRRNFRLTNVYGEVAHSLFA